MAERSYNGWPASARSSDIGIVPLVVEGVSFPPGVRSGHVETVLRYVAEQFNGRVEPLVAGWCWGYAYRENRNAANLSCHASGTAIDINAPRHPNGKRGTFGVKQAAEIRAICREAGVVKWGGDFAGTKDEMHFEIKGTAAEVAAAAARLTARRGTVEAAVSELPVLEKGAKGEHVQTLQGLLLARSQKVEMTGVFDDATAKGVEGFQKWAGLDADQVVGPMTWRALITREKAA